MATFLDALAELVSGADARADFRVDPPRWLRDRGAASLCGEDVVAAVHVLRRWHPDQADQLSLEGAPDPAPAPGEAELAAAVRQLDHLLAPLN